MENLVGQLRLYKNQFLNFLKSPINSNWTPELKEGDNYRDSVVIRKSNHHLYVYDKDGKIVYHQPIATGQNSGQKEANGDFRTPVGKFSISSYNPNADSNYFGHNIHYGLYTPAGEGRALATGIGIHGDAGDPYSIGSNASHGCIRCNNSDLEVLGTHLGGKSAIDKTVYILGENDKYKFGGKI